MTEIHVRPLAPESDLPALVDLLTAIRHAEGNPTPATADELRPALAAPRTRRWVAPEPDGDGLIGLAVLFHQTPDRCYGDIRVHPAWRRRGVGRALSDALAAGAAELGTRYLAIDVAAGQTGGAADQTGGAADNREALRFLLSQGYRYRGDTWALSLPAAAELPAPVWPAGYEARSLAEVDDLPLFVDLCNATFGDLWGHHENTPGLVTVERMAEGLSDPAGAFLVFGPDGAAVGQCRTFPAAADAPPDAPHVLDQPGIVPDHRAAGLHAPLALTAARWLRELGARPIRLESWGESAATIALYETLGFALVEHEVSYVRGVGR
ncbi:MAG: GNAT family N-acetyltransferase [Candidatus Promineofilum sp.]|nr:GNAT family N-acetyltransferase [Promineifilum sp.]